MEEIWKDIEGYEGMYQVSDLGRVRSFDKEVPAVNGSTKIIKGRILKLNQVNNSGYATVGLGSKKERKTHLVHRLVAIAFCDNPYNKDCVNHKDQNKLNNNANNLEWCTHKENTNYGDCIERGSAKQRKSFIQKTMDGKVVKVWNGFKKMQRESEYNRHYVSECCRGKRKSYMGYLWEYE